MVDSADFDGDPKLFLDLFDFQLEDIDLGSGKDDWDALQHLEVPTDFSMGISSALYGGIPNDFSKETKNLSMSYDRTCRIDQLPSAAESTSSTGVLVSDDSSDVKPMHLFKTSSPVSILESSSSCFAENPRGIDPKTVIPAKRARTKRSRSRPSNFKRLYTLPLIWETSLASEGLHPSAACEFDSGTLQTSKVLKPARRTPKKKKASPHFSGSETRDLSSQQTGETKRCSHCDVTSTPQWREGPMGPKTLCNACGVRYRSGRLFPEYRPAASPTFIPSVHSNSHKKVIEMRNKASQGINGSRASVQLYYRSQSGNSVRQLIV